MTAQPDEVRRRHDGAVADDSVQSMRIVRVLIWIVAAGVVLQGLWAGVFLQHDWRGGESAAWVDVHARAGELTILVAGAATVVAYRRLRHRRAMYRASAALTALLVLEAFLGGLIRDHNVWWLTAVHIPLAMVLVWLTVELALSRTPKPSDQQTPENGRKTGPEM
jgi:Ca2+/Na+ antiporter